MAGKHPHAELSAEAPARLLGAGRLLRGSCSEDCGAEALADSSTQLSTRDELTTVSAPVETA